MAALLRCQTTKGEGTAQLWKGMFQVKRFLFPGVGVALPRIPRPHEGDPSWLPRRACGPRIPRWKLRTASWTVHPAIKPFDNFYFSPFLRVEECDGANVALTL